MKDVLICLALDQAAGATAVVGSRLATALRATPRRVHVVEGSERIETVVAELGLPLALLEGTPVDALLDEAARASVVAVVLGLCAARDAPRLGGLAHTIATRLGKPVLIVPPTFDVTRVPDVPKVLLPLDGAQSTSEGAREPIARLVAAGATVRVLHVFDGSEIPRFWENPEYDVEPWRREFLARHCELPGVECVIKRGNPAQHVLEEATTGDFDVIALVWSQELAEGRGDVVRAVLSTVDIPVLLLPAQKDEAG